MSTSPTMSFLKRSFSRRKPDPINLSAAEEQGSNTFFDALLKSCATPAAPARTSISGYESTPEPLGHPEPPNLHRHCTAKAVPIVPESKYYRTSDGLERELLKPSQAAGAAQWPTRTSSIRGFQRFANTYQNLIQNDHMRKHPPCSLASVETNEEPYIEDGYDHYSEQRHEVLWNHGFWPGLKRDDSERLRTTRKNKGEVRKPMEDYDRRPPSLRRENATLGAQNLHDNFHGPTPSATPEKSLDVRRSVLFEPHPAPQPIVQPLSHFLSVTPSTIGLVPRPLFSKGQLPSRWSHSDLDSHSISDLEAESEFSLPFEDSSIFRSRGGGGDATPLTPQSYWPQSCDADRPAFRDVKLEEYRLSDPGLLGNVSQPMPETPYLHLSWETLTPEEYLRALGHHALAQDLELPLVYAARPNIGKDWTEEGGVATEVDKFNGRVEEMCKVELATLERMNERDRTVRRECGLDELAQNVREEERPDSSILVPKGKS